MVIENTAMSNDIWADEIKQAKVMEWKQLVDAWVNGNDCEPKEVTQDYAEKYYKEVYGVEGTPDTSSPNIKNK